MIHETSAFISAKLATLSMVLIAASFSVNDISIPFFGVPLTVVGMAAAGAILSFAYGAREAKRARMYLLFFVNTCIGATAVSALPALMGWSWPPAVQPPLAFFIALCARWVMPILIESIPGAIGDALRRITGGSQTPPKGGNPP